MGCERQHEFGYIFLPTAIVQIKICLIYYALKMQYFDFKNIIFLFEMIWGVIVLIFPFMRKRKHQ